MLVVSKSISTRWDEILDFLLNLSRQVACWNLVGFLCPHHVQSVIWILITFPASKTRGKLLISWRIELNMSVSNIYGLYSFFRVYFMWVMLSHTGLTQAFYLKQSVCRRSSLLFYLLKTFVTCTVSCHWKIVHHWGWNSSPMFLTEAAVTNKNLLLLDVKLPPKDDQILRSCHPSALLAIWRQWFLRLETS